MVSTRNSFLAMAHEWQLNPTWQQAPRIPLFQGLTASLDREEVLKRLLAPLVAL